MKNNENKIVSKKTLINRIISTNHELKKYLVDEIVSKFLIEINKVLISGEEVKLNGSFTLKTTITKPRVAMNLHTKKKMTVPARRVPKIKFSAVLKEQIAKKK